MYLVIYSRKSIGDFSHFLYRIVKVHKHIKCFINNMCINERREKDELSSGETDGKLKNIKYAKCS